MRVASILAVSSFLIVPPATGQQSRSLLFLFSNSRILPASIELERAFREALVDTPNRHVEVFPEFLDQPAFSGAVYEQTVATYLSEKYAARPPEIMVVAGQAALEFVLRHRAQLFANAPVVHVAVDKAFIQSIEPLPADFVGVPTAYDFAGTVQQALLWHPNTQRLVLVTGESSWDRQWESSMRADLRRLDVRPTVEFLAAQPTDLVVQRLRALGKGDVVVTPGYFRDGAGRAFLPRESITLMSAASAAPVYSFYNTFMGTGIVGGRMATYSDMGVQGAKIVNSLIDGAAPASLKLPASIPSQVQIDWRQASKWGIGENDIPRDTIVQFKEPTFWEAHRNQAILLAAVFLIQAALIAALLIERRLRHRTASALEDSEKRMNLAARAARLSIWIWDVTRNKVWATPRVHANAGLPIDTPLQFDQVLNSVHPADREGVARAVRQVVARNRHELDVEYRMIRPGGEVRWIAARGRAEKGEPERLMGVAMDITARKVAELQAEKDRTALTHMTRVSLLGQLSASIAHQLNQPLAAILGNAEAARKMLERGRLDVAELKEICDDIVSEDNRAAEVIRRLGALYKRGEMKVSPLDLNDLVSETLDMVRTELMTRQIMPALELAPSLPPIDGGRIQLQQVLLNLILNAADAMVETEVSQRNLTIRTEPDGEGVRLCVVDRGTGIAPEDHSYVFEPFWSTKAGGIGIGLAIGQSIVTAHHGTLTVVNNSEGGATFCVTLPIRQPV